MPLRMRGSVRARFRVRFSAVSAVRNAFRSDGEDVDAAGVDRTQFFFAAQDMQGGSAFRASFGQEK